MLQLANGRPEVRRIVLFGSFARGDGGPSSDVDLLIVISKSTLSFLDGIASYMPSHFPVGVGVFPYTEEELQQMLDQKNFFVIGALETGTEVFKRFD